MYYPSEPERCGKTTVLRKDTVNGHHVIIENSRKHLRIIKLYIYLALQLRDEMKHFSLLVSLAITV